MMETSWWIHGIGDPIGLKLDENYKFKEQINDSCCATVVPRQRYAIVEKTRHCKVYCIFQSKTYCVLKTIGTDLAWLEK